MSMMMLRRKLSNCIRLRLYYARNVTVALTSQFSLNWGRNHYVPGPGQHKIRVNQMKDVVRYCHTIRHDHDQEETDENQNQKRDKNQRVEDDEVLRQKVLDHALEFVKEVGWTNDAISKAIEILRYSLCPTQV